MNELILTKEIWKTYFDWLTGDLRGQHVEIEIVGLDLGDQIEREWVLFEGVSYDHHNDAINVYTASLSHAIGSPLEVIVLEEGNLARAILVKDQEKRSHIMKFKTPLMLPESLSSRSYQ